MATTVPGSRLVSAGLEARAIAWRRTARHPNPERSFEEHDLEGLPIPEGNDAPSAFTRPGVMHACASDGPAAVHAATAVEQGECAFGTMVAHHHLRCAIDEAALRGGTAVSVRPALDALG
ncbi:MAG: hypothetical protein EXQ81_07020 [Thermoleophilia bacterium]|nr:hypothetical protein [Thermoleophilia bacterium]